MLINVMVNAVEFRVGNLVQDFEHGDPSPYYKVEQIICKDFDVLYVVYRNGSVRARYPEPIEITEEVLIK